MYFDISWLYISLYYLARRKAVLLTGQSLPLIFPCMTIYFNGWLHRWQMLTPCLVQKSELIIRLWVVFFSLQSMISLFKQLRMDVIWEQEYLDEILLQSCKCIWFFEKSKIIVQGCGFFSVFFVPISGLQNCKTSGFFHPWLSHSILNISQQLALWLEATGNILFCSFCYHKPNIMKCQGLSVGQGWTREITGKKVSLMEQSEKSP